MIDQDKGFYLTATNRTGGRLALVQPEAGEVKVIDTRARRVLARWSHAGATTAEFSPDGAQMVVNGATGGAPAAIYAAATGTVVRVLGAAPGRLARWSPGGAWVLAGDGKEVVRLWHAGTWEPGPTLPPGTQNGNFPAAFAPDDRTLVLRSSEDLQLFDLVTGATTLTLAIPDRITFLSDLEIDGSQQLGALNIDGRMYLWDLAAVKRELAAMGLGPDSGR